MIAFTVVLTACGGDEATADDVIKAFKDAGLEAEEPTEMTKDDYGVAPMKSDEGLRFLVPSIAEGAGGRVITYSNQDDLDEMKEYYDSLGEESAMLFSWTAKSGNVLLQINGDLEEDKFNEYKKALESVTK
ncbi:stress protein [Virgibacillus sp. 6R]|uniref:stress protein n=2 Tax=unclassified Virgibacillus TaxID=2620237 RepID=UPI0012ECAF53|nr:stress protein [Virgibacillus sp. 6R]